MPAWKDDEALFSLMRAELFTAVIGDVLDTMGLLHQFLPPELEPLHEDMTVIGRVMPVLEADFMADARESQIAFSKKPYGMVFEALDDLKQNEVYFATGAHRPYALWGELMSTRAMHLKAAGAVLDGYHRDTRGILKLNFPTFSRGRYAADQGLRGKVLDFRIPVQASNGVWVAPGDVMYADLDGVLVIPRAAEQEAISKALEKVRSESLVRRAIQQGMSTVEAFRKYGVM